MARVRVSVQGLPAADERSIGVPKYLVDSQRSNNNNNNNDTYSVGTWVFPVPR